MWSVREKADLLRANGHSNVGLYSIGRINEEAEIVSNRENQRIATEASLLQLAVASILSKDAGKLFKEQVTKLIEG